MATTDLAALLAAVELAHALPDDTVLTIAQRATPAQFYLPRPRGQPKGRRTLPTSLPDLDKLIRSTDDALKTAAVSPRIHSSSAGTGRRS